MRFIVETIKKTKKPVPLKIILVSFEKKKIANSSVKWALNALLSKGYIRRAYTTKANTTAYVQLRTL